MVDIKGYEQNKLLVHRIVDEMFNRGRLDVAAEIFAPEFIDHGHEQFTSKTGGPRGFAELVQAVRAALPDINATIKNVIADGDYVAMWNTATATHRGTLFGMPPSGKRISMKDFHFFRFSNGKIVEHWNSVSFG